MVVECVLLDFGKIISALINVTCTDLGADYLLSLVLAQGSTYRETIELTDISLLAKLANH